MGTGSGLNTNDPTTDPNDPTTDLRKIAITVGNGHGTASDFNDTSGES